MLDEKNRKKMQPNTLRSKAIFFCYGVTNVAMTSKIIGASILPFSIDPHYGGLYFLLGKEKKTFKYRGSDKWSDFGGSSKSNESASETASREFHEETAAIVPFFRNEPLPRQQVSLIQDALEQEQYYLKIEFEQDNHVKYVTYVKQIPWNPMYPMTFATNINKLIQYSKGKVPPEDEIHPAVTKLEENPQINRDYMEKQCLQYWSIPQLTYAVGASRHVLGLRSNRPEMLGDSFVSRLAPILEKFPTQNGNEQFLCGQYPNYIFNTPLQRNATIILRRNGFTKRKESHTPKHSIA
jgi:hypothetical protein